VEPKYFIFTCLVLIVLYFSYRKQINQFEPKKRRKIYVTGVVIFASISFVLTLFQSQDIARIEQGLSDIGFVRTTEGQHHFQIKNFDVTLTYVVQASTRPDIKSYFELLIERLPADFYLRGLFCDDREFQTYSSSKSGWFPTPVSKLENQHYVGKCYASGVSQAISKLPPREHGFRSRATMNLFIPRIENGNLKLRMYTENTDTKSLLTRLNDFIDYYEIVLQ